jgi:hypothetical protein
MIDPRLAQAEDLADLTATQADRLEERDLPPALGDTTHHL